MGTRTKDDYIATIGLEIHAELKTSSKMFCSCKNDPDEEKPNVNICPICLGHPGTLPVLNKQAIKHVLKIGYAVNGTINNFTEWDRKNYFYPDIPKGYQISQYKYPLVTGGEVGGIKITRIHLEEDTGQSTHDTHDKSLINFNRAGVPLMELVTEPVIHDAKTALVFAQELQLLLRFLGVGEANMEKGEMRVEANISVATKQDTLSKKFGTKTEVKNLNSFKVVEKAILYEIARQIDILIDGGMVVQETRGWDEDRGETYSQRVKESSHDYRYFPDPDIPKLLINEIRDFSEESLRKEIGELPWEKRERYKKSFGMTDKEISVFISNTELAKYFENIISYIEEKKGSDSKKDERIDDNKKMTRLVTNYILTDYLGLIKNELAIDTIKYKNFGDLISMIDEGILSSRGAKDLLSILITESIKARKENTDIDVKNIVDKNNLAQKSDEKEIKDIVKDIVDKNTKVVEDYRKGKTMAIQFLVGQGMKMTKGTANPEILRKIILDLLK